MTNKVLEHTAVPVEVIAGDSVSKWGHYGIPIVLSVLVALLQAAAD